MNRRTEREGRSKSRKEERNKGGQIYKESLNTERERDGNSTQI